MANEIVRQDVQSLIERWKQAELCGDPFPVDFDTAWTIAGYSRKDSAKRYLPKSSAGKLYHVYVEKTKGRPKDVIRLSLNGLKHLCLMADTPEGDAIRDYFIEAEQRWQIVQQIAPDVAAKAELLAMEIELAKIQAQKEQAIAAAKQADLQLVQFRHFVTTALPEPQQQKILGYTTVEKIEYRDRVLHNDDLINDGSTISKTELCHRHGILTKNGKPDYKRLNAMLEKLPSEAFDLTVRLQDNRELRREYLAEFDRVVERSERNLYLGE